MTLLHQYGFNTYWETKLLSTATKEILVALAGSASRLCILPLTAVLVLLQLGQLFLTDVAHLGRDRRARLWVVGSNVVDEKSAVYNLELLRSCNFRISQAKMTTVT